MLFVFKVIITGIVLGVLNFDHITFKHSIIYTTYQYMPLMEFELMIDPVPVTLISEPHTSSDDL